MNKKEQLRRRIIELIHGLPYSQAIEKEWVHGAYIEDEEHSPSRIMFSSFGTGNLYFGTQIGSEGTTNFMTGYRNPKIKMLGLHITLGRLTYAINQFSADDCTIEKEDDITYSFWVDGSRDFEWIIVNEDNTEATLDDQSEETIEALHQLLITE